MNDALNADIQSHLDPDLAACYEEIAQRMQPGALLVTADMMGSRGTPPFASTLAAWASWRARRGADAAELAGYFRRVRHELETVTEERYQTLLVDAGFSSTTQFFGAFAVAGYFARNGAP